MNSITHFPGVQSSTIDHHNNNKSLIPEESYKSVFDGAEEALNDKDLGSDEKAAACHGLTKCIEIGYATEEIIQIAREAMNAADFKTSSTLFLNLVIYGHTTAYQEAERLAGYIFDNFDSTGRPNAAAAINVLEANRALIIYKELARKNFAVEKAFSIMHRAIRSNTFDLQRTANGMLQAPPFCSKPSASRRMRLLP